MVGVSGAGKSTVARLAAARLGAPYFELDAIHHGPNSAELPAAELRAIVTELAAGDVWVIDGNYRKVRDLIWGRATLVAWVDPSKLVVMAQVLWRSFWRAVRAGVVARQSSAHPQVNRPGPSHQMGVAHLCRAASGA